MDTRNKRGSQSLCCVYAQLQTLEVLQGFTRNNMWGLSCFGAFFCFWSLVAEVENVTNFDWDSMADALKAECIAEIMVVSPVRLGIPVSREGLFGILLRRGRVRWQAHVERFDVEQAFKNLFARSVELQGDQLLQADADSVAATLDVARMLVDCQRKEDQTSCIPALLKSSSLWSHRLQRLALPTEHLKLQGYSLYGEAAENSSIASTSADRPTARALAGNGMHLAMIGCLLTFILSHVEKL